MNRLPLISIVFPVYNGGANPRHCLDSIAHLNYPKSKLEVIVVDNHSTDGSVKNLAQVSPRTKVISLPENLGFARAINVGAAKARGEYLFIGNDDVLFDRESVSILVDHLNAHPEVGVVGGKIFSLEDPTRLSSAGYLMNMWTGNVYFLPPANQVSEPDWIQGCALLMRKEIFKKIGGLDPGFEHFFEDFDLCLRVKKMAYKVVCLPQAHFWHGESTTANKNLSDKYTNWYKSKFRFILKHLPLVKVCSIVCIQIFVIAPYRALILGDGRFVPFLKGLWWNVTHLSETLSARYANR